MYNSGGTQEAVVIIIGRELNYQIINKAVYIALMKKVGIQLFSIQLWVNSRAEWAL